MKTKTPPRSLATQAEEMKGIWQELLGLQGHLRSALPVNLIRAKAHFGATDGEAGRGGGEYQLHAFYRVAAVFAEHAKPLTMGEISETLNVPLSTATRMVDSLVDHKYAERLPDAQDRRIVRVTLTPDGRELFETFNQFFSERMCEFLTHFDPAEREQLLHLFGKTVIVLRQMES